MFTAGGRGYTWAHVIDAARMRGDWATLQRDLLRLLAREDELGGAEALPVSEVRAAANEFRYRLGLLSADELQDWLKRHDVTVDEWMGEMRRSLLEPVDHEPNAEPQVSERASWVHAVCSGKLAEFSQTLAEEVAVNLSEKPAVAGDELGALPQQRQRFCETVSEESALVGEIANNKIDWTRIDLRLLKHPDENLVREAALCVKLDGRPLADVARDAGTPLRERSVLLQDVEPALRIRLLAAEAGELVGPLRVGGDHELALVVRRVSPRIDDPAVRRRAAETVVRRALAAEVNRHVTWHEHF